MKTAQGKPSRAKSGSTDRRNLTQERDMGSPMVSKKEFPALTTFNIQVHRKLHNQEAINASSSTPQDFIHGIETLFVPGARVKGRRLLWKTLVEAMDGKSFIFGQVHDPFNDSSTLIIVKASSTTTAKKTKISSVVDTKEQQIVKEIPAPNTSPTGSLTSTLSSIPKSKGDDDDYEQQRLKTTSHIRRLVESIIRRRRKEEWMSSLREPTKYNDKMEMVFFDRIPVEKKEESFQEVFVFEGFPVCEA